MNRRNFISAAIAAPFILSGKTKESEFSEFFRTWKIQNSNGDIILADPDYHSIIIDPSFDPLTPRYQCIFPFVDKFVSDVIAGNPTTELYTCTRLSGKTNLLCASLVYLNKYKNINSTFVHQKHAWRSFLKTMEMCTLNNYTVKIFNDDVFYLFDNIDAATVKPNIKFSLSLI